MRPAHTYRGARRNACLRPPNLVTDEGVFSAPKGEWGPRWYYSPHRATYSRATGLSKMPSRYHPLADIGRFLASVGRRWVGRNQVVVVDQTAPYQPNVTVVAPSRLAPMSTAGAV